jgi:hypothetical protein
LVKVIHATLAEPIQEENVLVGEGVLDDRHA